MIINGFLLRYIRFVSSSFVLLSYCSVMDCVSETFISNSNKISLNWSEKYILYKYFCSTTYLLLNYIEKVIKLLNYLISVLLEAWSNSIQLLFFMYVHSFIEIMLFIFILFQSHLPLPYCVIFWLNLSRISIWIQMDKITFFIWEKQLWIKESNKKYL